MKRLVALAFLTLPAMAEAAAILPPSPVRIISAKGAGCPAGVQHSTSAWDGGFLVTFTVAPNSFAVSLPDTQRSEAIGKSCDVQVAIDLPFFGCATLESARMVTYGDLWGGMDLIADNFVQLLKQENGNWVVDKVYVTPFDRVYGPLSGYITKNHQPLLRDTNEPLKFCRSEQMNLRASVMLGTEGGTSAASVQVLQWTFNFKTSKIKIIPFEVDGSRFQLP